MKWFKHLSGSSNNSIIFEAVELFGSEGYHVFFGVLEMMADEFDIYNPGHSRISLKKIQKNLQLSRQKTVKILAFFDQKAKENQKKNVAFFATIDGTHVDLFCSRLAELSDNHTKKLLKKTTEPERSEDEETPPQEVEVEVDKEEDKYNSAMRSFVSGFISYIKKESPTMAPRGENVEKKALESIDLLIRVDGFALEYISQVMRFAVTDDFWKNNVYSLGALRKKGDDGRTKFQKIAAAYEKRGVTAKGNSGNAAACADFTKGSL